MLQRGVNSVLAFMNLSSSCSSVAEECNAEELDIGYSFECVYFWVPPLITGRQTGDSLNGRKKALRDAGRQACRESLAELVLALNRGK